MLDSFIRGIEVGKKLSEEENFKELFIEECAKFCKDRSFTYFAGIRTEKEYGKRMQDQEDEEQEHYLTAWMKENKK